MAQKGFFCLLSIIAFLIALCIGLIIALIIVILSHHQAPTDPYKTELSQDTEMAEKIRDKLLNSFDAERMRDDLRIMSKTVHWSGTEENRAVKDLLVARYKSLGYDTRTYDYDVLLSYPDVSSPNSFWLVNYNTSSSEADCAERRQKLSDGLGDRLGPKEAQQQMNSPKAPIWWNGYSKDGEASGELVYANYGRYQDYQVLDALNVNLTGKIVLVRYAFVWRGSKVYEAEKRGAVGVVMYMDPYDYHAHGAPGESHAFPNGMDMPSGGAQRGTLKLWDDGDAGTWFLPSKSYAFRSRNESMLRNDRVLPNVPVMPVGYRDAIKILKSMNGPSNTLPKGWQGGLNVTYRLTSTQTYRLKVNAQTNVSTITNVCAFLHGSTERDRMVLLSNHYDAWTNGAIDPNSGTTVMLEMARVLMGVVNSSDWRPRRTIAFCNWDAEEFGMIGSTEWIQEQEKLLQTRLVAVLNLDGGVRGNQTILPQGSPTLLRPLIEAAKQIPNPNADEVAAGRATVFDSWYYWFPIRNALPGLDPPLLKTPGSASDHYNFMAYTGAPVMFHDYECAPPGCYYLYHTEYEVPWTVEHLFDPGFTVHRAIAQLTLECARSLADTLVIPLDLRKFANVVEQGIRDLNYYLNTNNITQDIGHWATVAQQEMKMAVNRLNIATSNFQDHVDAVNVGYTKCTLARQTREQNLKNRTELRKVEMLNKRMTDFERAFINDRGVYAQRQGARHVVFASDLKNIGAGLLFSGVREPAWHYINARDSSDNSTTALMWLTELQQGYSDVQYAIESAITLLRLDGYDA